MTEYTPGPWMTDGVVVWDSTGDVPICVMTSRQAGGLVQPADNAPLCGLGNADLTAAAPELLEGLIEAGSILASTFGNITDPGNPDGWDDPEMYRSWQRIVAAIAKAEGK